MSEAKGSYKFWSGNVRISGDFQIYQARSGAIIMIMGKVNTTLTLQQINDLGIPCYELDDFCKDSFDHYYRPQAPEAPDDREKELRSMLNGMAFPDQIVSHVKSLLKAEREKVCGGD